MLYQCICRTELAHCTFSPEPRYHTHLKPHCIRELKSLRKRSKAKHETWNVQGKPTDTGTNLHQEYKSAKYEFSSKYIQVIADANERGLTDTVC